jgi:hypothetical protein
VKGTDGGLAGARWLIVMSGAASLAQPALAGAWPQPPDTTQSINTVARERDAFSDVWRTESLNQFGLKDGWTLGVKLENETRNEFNDTSISRSGFALGLQKSLSVGDRGAIGISANYIGGDSFEGPDCPGEGFETRLSGGSSFSLMGHEGFVNLEGGLRSHGVQACDRLIGEVAAGVDLGAGFTFIAKSWAREGGEEHSAKVEASMMYDFGDLSAGLGWREGVYEGANEKGWLVSVWRNF